MRRPIPKWTRYLHKEDPLKKDRRRIISLYKLYEKTERDFEPDIKEQMGDTRTKQGPTYPITGEKLYWIYVGDYWWCRRRRSRKYEFARMYALAYEDNGRIYDGLWNEARHAPGEYPRIVHKDDKKGYIVEYNKFEIWIQWEDEYLRREPQTSYSSLDGISFEYEEDEKYFTKLLGEKNG